MKIGILSMAPSSYSTKRLMQAAEHRGHKANVLKTSQFAISLEEQYPDLYYERKPIALYDAIIPRISASMTYYGTSVVRQFESMGVFSANSAASITYSRDKLRCLQILSRHDVGITHTAFVRDRKDVLPAIQRVGGAPIIIKLIEGTQGVGVILAETIKVAEAIVETLQSTKQNVLIQKFVAESKGTDVRAFVVGDRVVAAMRRTAQGTEFRSNIHRGGSAEAITLDPEYERTAIRAAQIVGLRVAGIDLLEAKDGPHIMEVNSSPGLEGIETATRMDVAGAIIEFIEDRVALPDMDLRQKLTVTEGYGVGEIPIPKKSMLAGKTIVESELSDRDILVLTLRRGKRVIPNPRATRKLRAGDRLLCFGRLSEMKALIPTRKKRRFRRLTKKVVDEVLATTTDEG